MNLPAGVWGVLCGLSLLAGCDSGGPFKDATESISSGDAVRHNDPAQIARGREVYSQNCAVCHGDNAQGAFDWRRRGPDGFWPPPPLNGSGHAWHHPKAVLKEMIKNGSPPGQGKMPAWQGRLSDEDIEAVIAWFQSLWPDEIHRAWYVMDQRSFGR